MTDKILNWGLLSTARINRSLIPALRISKRSNLLAVASRSQESAEAFAKNWKIPHTHSSYEALLADPEIDVIYNPLPNHLHAEWTIKAVEAGKHVLCEKPMALNVDEVDAIAAAAGKHGRIVAEAFMYRHHPQTLKVQGQEYSTVRLQIGRDSRLQGMSVAELEDCLLLIHEKRATGFRRRRWGWAVWLP